MKTNTLIIIFGIILVLLASVYVLKSSQKPTYVPPPNGGGFDVNTGMELLNNIIGMFGGDEDDNGDDNGDDETSTFESEEDFEDFYQV